MTSRRLVVVISSIEPGGAEGVAVRLSNAWAQTGHQVTLVTLLSRPNQLELHPSIEHLSVATDQPTSTQQFSSVVRNLASVAAIRKILKAKSPDFVISHMDQTNIQVLLASIGLRYPVIVVEHVDPRYHAIPLSWSFLRRLTFPLAARIVTVCRGMMKGYPANLRRRMVAIPNPVVVPHMVGETVPTNKAIVAMGRLTYQKGFDILLQAFAIVTQRHHDASLTIWGSGPEHGRLTALAEELRLSKRVRLPGFTDTPFDALSRGSVFVLPSRYEGFGLVLPEAMALGIPVVATNCPSGPDEIVRDGVDGLLVPPEQPGLLAEALCAVLDDPELATRLASNARDVRNRFSLSRAIDDWDTVFDGLRPQ